MRAAGRPRPRRSRRREPRRRGRGAVLRRLRSGTPRRESAHSRPRTIRALANGRDLSYIREMPTKDGYDYAAKETMVAAEPKQLKALADPLRAQLIQLLRDRARSTQEIAEELGL